MKLTPSILNNTRKQKLDYDNTMLHLAGLYNNYALSSALATAFGKRSVSYLREPLDITSTEEELEEKRAKREHERNMANWLHMVAMSNQKFQR